MINEVQLDKSGESQTYFNILLIFMNFHQTCWIALIRIGAALVQRWIQMIIC